MCINIIFSYEELSQIFIRSTNNLLIGFSLFLLLREIFYISKDKEIFRMKKLKRR